MQLRERLSSALGSGFTLEDELPGGGMSRVFVARDHGLDRRIVVKVLPEEMAVQVSIERFQREIALAAKLQHPHIVPLLSAGQDSTLPYFTMPFVEGESLRGRLNRTGELPVSEGLRLLREAASALAYAHDRGVVHRDIKPENVLLSAGTAMITDFGVAKAISASSNAELTTGTPTGMALGTPTYMAPEQAAAAPNVDGRADIYALGVVAYEMFGGHPPFAGRSPQATLAAHVSETPDDIRRFRQSISPELGALIMRCLEKNPADRPQHASDIVRAVEGIASGGFTSTTAASRAPAHIGMRRVAAAGWVVALVFAGIAIGMRPRPVAPTVARYPVRLPDSLSDAAQLERTLAISPDGSTLVVSAGGVKRHLYAIRLDDGEARAIPGTDSALTPAFSPDGRTLAFFSQTRIRTVSLSGGPGAEVTLVTGVQGITWASSDEIIYSGAGTLWRVAARGGEPARVVGPDTVLLRQAFRFPSPLPGGKYVLAMMYKGRGTIRNDSSRIVVVSLRDGSVDDFGGKLRGTGPVFVSSGHIVFVGMDGAALAVRFNPRTRKISGEVVRVLSNLPVGPQGNVGLSISPNGTLVHRVGNVPLSKLVAVDRKGTERAFIDSLDRYLYPRVSRDGRKLLVTVDASPTFVENANPPRNVLLINLENKSYHRIVGDGSGVEAEWSVHGDSIAVLRRVFASTGDRLYLEMYDANGAGPARTIFDTSSTNVHRAPSDYSFGRRFLAGSAGVLRWITPVDSPQVVGRTILLDRPRLSPDEQFVMGASQQSGRAQLYAQHIDSTRLEVISGEGGSDAQWSTQGDRIYYREAGRWMMATLSLRPNLKVISRDTLFADIYPPGSQGHGNMSPIHGTESLLLVKPVEVRREIIVVVNWITELRKRMGADADAGR